MHEMKGHCSSNFCLGSTCIWSKSKNACISSINFYSSIFPIKTADEGALQMSCRYTNTSKYSYFTSGLPLAYLSPKPYNSTEHRCQEFEKALNFRAADDTFCRFQFLFLVNRCFNNKEMSTGIAMNGNGTCFPHPDGITFVNVGTIYVYFSFN